MLLRLYSSGRLVCICRILRLCYGLGCFVPHQQHSDLHYVGRQVELSSSLTHGSCRIRFIQNMICREYTQFDGVERYECYTATPKQCHVWTEPRDVDAWFVHWCWIYLSCRPLLVERKEWRCSLCVVIQIVAIVGVIEAADIATQCISRQARLDDKRTGHWNCDCEDLPEQLMLLFLYASCSR